MQSCGTGVPGPVVFEGRVGRMGEKRRVPTPSAPCTARNREGEARGAVRLDAQQQRELLRSFAEVGSAASYELAADTDRDSASSSPGREFSRSISSYSSSGSDGAADKAETMNALQKARKPSAEDPLVALANCVHDLSPSPRASKSDKVRKVFDKIGVSSAVCRFLKNLFKVVKVKRDQQENCGAMERVDTMVVPRRIMSASNRSPVDVQPAQIKPAPRRTRSLIQFQTVHSTQRDVEPWTMEEYMRRQGRLHTWNNRNHDKEFGGIEGNNLMNQYFDYDDVTATYDSDSD